ncbi:phosphoserine phosphatase SerB [Yimella sp. cx-573]|nr:phosphoserine phosphatase SerB [Yimella sp. cx-573]
MSGNTPSDTVLLTVTATDQPGITTSLLQQLPSHAAVLDLEQVVVRGRLTLCVLTDQAEAVMAQRPALQQWAGERGLQLDLHDGRGDNPARRPGRAYLVVLAPRLSSDTLATISAAVAESRANIDRIRRLARDPVTALEFDISGADVVQLRRTLSLLAAELEVDIAVAPGGLARRGRRLLVMDVDSTLIRDEVIELLARHAGREQEVAAVTERAMRGELDFAESLHERVKTLAGLPVSVLDEVRSQVRLSPGAATLVRTVKRLGYTVGVVSGGFIEIVGPLAAELGIDHAHANALEVAGGRLTGRVEGAVVDRAEKARRLRAWAEQDGLPIERTVAVGDGANDLDMLAASGMGIAFNAKPVVQQQADTTVNVPYLDTVLFLLGISRDDIEDADTAGAADPYNPTHA